jgi:hypothetical protein
MLTGLLPAIGLGTAGIVQFLLRRFGFDVHCALLG